MDGIWLVEVTPRQNIFERGTPVGLIVGSAAFIGLWYTWTEIVSLIVAMNKAAGVVSLLGPYLIVAWMIDVEFLYIQTSFLLFGATLALILQRLSLSS